VENSPEHRASITDGVKNSRVSEKPKTSVVTLAQAGIDKNLVNVLLASLLASGERLLSGDDQHRSRSMLTVEPVDA